MLERRREQSRTGRDELAFEHLDGALRADELELERRRRRLGELALRARRELELSRPVVLERLGVPPAQIADTSGGRLPTLERVPVMFELGAVAELGRE